MYSLYCDIIVFYAALLVGLWPRWHQQKAFKSEILLLSGYSLPALITMKL